MDTAPHKRWEDYPGWYLSTFPLRKMGSPTIAPIHQLSPFWKFCLLEGKWTSTSSAVFRGRETLERTELPQDWLVTVISALTCWAFAQELHAEGLFMNSGKYPFWKMHTSKANTLIYPLNTLAVLALLHVWTLLCARAAVWFLHAASRKNLHFE